MKVLLGVAVVLIVAGYFLTRPPVPPKDIATAVLVFTSSSESWYLNRVEISGPFEAALLDFIVTEQPEALIVKGPREKIAEQIEVINRLTEKHDIGRAVQAPGLMTSSAVE